MDGLDPDVLRYYSAEWDEDARLRSGLNELEFIRTRELVRRHLPRGPLDVADVGGGSGIHSEWLLDDGHRVTLIDPVPNHVDQSMDRLGNDARFRAVLGDGRSLPLGESEVDATLLFGPLYHLPDRSDRVGVLAEALRVTRPGGLLAAAAITRFASLFAGLEEGEIFVPDFQQVIRQDLTSGQHRNPDGRDYFTTAFFHHPDELVAEAIEAGVEDIALFAVEGPIMTTPQNAEWWADPSKREHLLEAVRAVEQEPTLMGIGPHMLLFGRVPS